MDFFWGMGIIVVLWDMWVCEEDWENRFCIRGYYWYDDNIEEKRRGGSKEVVVSMDELFKKDKDDK